MISYTKKIQVPFIVYHPKIHRIPVVQKEKIRFYEKYIVLALNNGIKARDIFELKEICSYIFNIKQSFVNDFIDFFSTLGYIRHDTKTGKFYLSNKYEIVYDDKDKAIMFANIDEKQADFSKLAYIDELNLFLVEKNLEKNGLYCIKKEKDVLSDYEEENFRINILNKSLKDVKEIIALSFKDENKSYSILDSKFLEVYTDTIKKSVYNIEILINYNYDGKQSVKTEILIPIQYELDQKYINEYCERFDVDTELPRFLKFEKEYEQHEKSFKDVEILVGENEKLELQVEEVSKKISKLSKTRVSSKDKEELKVKKREELKQKQEEIQRQITKNNTGVEILEQTISKEYEILEPELDVEIKKVYQKYKDDTEFDKSIRRYCIELDKFISMCISNVSDWKLNEQAAAIRNYGYQILKPVLDFVVKPKEKYKKVSDYLFAATKLTDVYHYFEKNKLLPLVSKMRYCNDGILHPFTHLFDEERKEENAEKRKDFKALSDKEKREYLLSFIRFYGSLKLTKKEKKKITANKNNEY